MTVWIKWVEYWSQSGRSFESEWKGVKLPDKIFILQSKIWTEEIRSKWFKSQDFEPAMMKTIQDLTPTQVLKWWVSV